MLKSGEEGCRNGLMKEPLLRNRDYSAIERKARKFHGFKKRKKSYLRRRATIADRPRAGKQSQVRIMEIALTD